MAVAVCVCVCVAVWRLCVCVYGCVCVYAAVCVCGCVCVILMAVRCSLADASKARASSQSEHSEVAALRDQLARKDTEVADLHARLVSAQNDARDAEATHIATKARVAELEGQVASLRQQVAASNLELDALNQEVTRLRARSTQSVAQAMESLPKDVAAEYRALEATVRADNDKKLAAYKEAQAARVRAAELAINAETQRAISELTRKAQAQMQARPTHSPAEVRFPWGRVCTLRAHGSFCCAVCGCVGVGVGILRGAVCVGG